MGYTQVSHDVFARFSLVRKTVDSSQGCAFCGQKRRGRLFVYGILPDDRLSGRVDWDTHKFCSVSCYRSYHF